MSNSIPRVVNRPMEFENGVAIGVSNRWHKGQYCSIFTAAGIVGCGVYDMATPSKFGQSIAIARGTPECPLVDPEDLLDAEIVDATEPAKAVGITIGMTGREAVEKLLLAPLD